MTNHAMFSLYIMTGLLALVISVSLFCKSIAEAKEWKRKFGERNWGLSFPSAHRVSRNRYIRLRHFHSIRNAITGFDSLICEGTKMTKCNRKNSFWEKASGMFGCAGT